MSQFVFVVDLTLKALADLEAASANMANSPQLCDYFISFPLEAHRNAAAFEARGSEASFTVSLHFLHSSFVLLKPIQFSGSSFAVPQLRLSWGMYA